jgi:hypothetical protein
VKKPKAVKKNIIMFMVYLPKEEEKETLNIATAACWPDEPRVNHHQSLDPPSSSSTDQPTRQYNATEPFVQ